MEKQLRNSKAVLFPLVAVLILVIMCVGVVNFLWGRVNEIRSQIAETEQQNEILANRLITLQDVQDNVVSNVNVASIALPHQNPSVLVTNIMKTKAEENNVSLSNLSINAVVTQPTVETETSPADLVNTYEVNFEATAPDYKVLYSFVNSLTNTRPLLNLSSVLVETGVGGSNVSAQVKVVAYSSPLPPALPALDQPLSGLTQQEQEVLALLESYTAPELASEEVSPTQIPPRDDPFSLGI